MKLFKKVHIISVLAMLLSVMFVFNNNTVSAQSSISSLLTTNDYDYKRALELSKENTNHLDFKPYDISKYGSYDAIGAVTLDQTGDKLTGGTGFVVGKHTILTAQHIIAKTDNAKRFHFFPKMNNGKKPLHFNIKSAKFVPNRDIALLYVEEDLTDYVTPLKIASTKKINSMQVKDRILMIGYPRVKTDEKRLSYLSRGTYLGESTSRVEYLASMKRYAGNSGSPVMNLNREVIGVHAHGFYPKTFNMTPEQISHHTAGVVLTGYARSYIDRNIK